MGKMGKAMTRPDLRIDCIIYPVEIGVFYTTTKADKWGKEKGIVFDHEGNEAWTDAPEDEDGNPYFLAYIPKHVDIPVISHECMHLAMFVLDYVGVDISPDNHEALCYLQEYILKKVLDKRHPR